MTLLQEVIDGASGGASATELLRKVKVIAARGEALPLATWVDHELGGYPEEAPIPDYRGTFDASAFGHFTGSFGAEMKNAPIPRGAFPDTFAWLFEIEFRQSVAELEALASGETLQAPWPADLVGGINNMLEAGEITLYRGYGLLSAWRSISVPQLVAVVDSVKTRVLDLALDLEKTSPEAGQAGAEALDPERARTIITHVYGDNPNIAVASKNFSQFVAVGRCDDSALRGALLELGLPSQLVESLFVALEEDKAEEGAIGPATSSWLSKATRMAYDLGIGTSSGLIANSLFAYLGIG